MLRGLLFPDALDPAVDYSLLRVSRRAMATRFEIALPAGTPNVLDAAEDALDLIDKLEDQLTVYRDHSEVSRLNAAAFDSPVKMERKLFDLLQHCAALTNETHGAFDIATGALIKAWGFFRREGRVPSHSGLAAAMHASGMKHVILDSTNRSARFRRRGLELNFGSIGKGYALDRAARLLRSKWGIENALLHGGGSSVLGLGTPPNDDRGWPVAIRHPFDPEKKIATVRLRDSALGTSAATYQSFEFNGKQYGHVLDPRTGRPAEGVASASAVANSAAEADAFATAYFVLGDEMARALRNDVSGVILDQDGSLHQW